MCDVSSTEGSIRVTFLSLLIASLLLLAPAGPALASTVDVTFSGAFTAGPLTGSSYSGTVTYDTNAAIVFTGANFRQFALATGALTVTIGSDTVHNTNGNVNLPDIIEVADFGRIEFDGNTMAGTGPLNGHNAFPSFQLSSDPALAALMLPFPFPKDFNIPTFAVNTAGGFSSGPIREFSAVNIPSGVPAPSAAFLFVSGATALALLRRRLRKTR